MALAKYGGVISELRGKEAGVIFSRNAYGSYMKQKVSPVNPQSEFQQAERAKLGGIAQLWAGLTDSQREAWSQLGQQVTRVNRFGDQTNYTGFNLFVRLNRNLALVGATTISDAPAVPSVPVLTLVSLAATSGTMTLAFTPTPLTTGFKMLLESTPNIMTGRRFFKNFYRMLGASAAAQTSPWSTLTIFTARHGGVPVEGAVIGVRARLIETATGFDSPIQTLNTTVTGA